MGRGCIFRIPARGAHSPLRPLPCRSFRLWPNAAAGREGGSVFSYSFSTARSQPPRQGEWRPWVALPSSASKIAGQSRFVPPDRMACVPQPRKSPAACPPQAGILLRKAAPASGRGLLARCMRAFCFAKPRLPPAGVCLPAACGHFASQNRRTPYFQKINAAVYVEPPSGEKAPLHGPGQGGSSLFLICR